MIAEAKKWSGWPDSNWQPLAPKASALPIAPHPDTCNCKENDSSTVAFFTDSRKRYFVYFLQKNYQNKRKWGERRGLNPRPPEPQPGALPTELRPPCKRYKQKYTRFRVKSNDLPPVSVWF